jgi:hypothetical protein
MKKKMIVKLCEWKTLGSEARETTPCRVRNIHDVGFIDPHIVNGYTLQHHPTDVEEDLWQFLTKQELKSDILCPYNFG